MLGLPLGPAEEQRLRDLARDAVQHETFYWLHRVLGRLAEEQPVCLVLDDLHWSDDATLALLDELLPVVQEAPVAFVVIHRSDPDHPAWQLVDRARRRLRHCFSELELQPLADAEARELAAATAGGDLPDELVAILSERTGGNPYFVAEAIRDLRERGAVQHENGRVVLVGDVTVPTAIQEALQARIDRLDGDARELLTTAAVIGRSFGLPLLERLLPRIRLLPTLSELQWLELIVEERGGAAPEYRFRHGLVREVAYGTLVDARRRELHLRVGTALEELYRESPGEVYGLLGHHFAEAGEPGWAVEYLMKAGDAARAVYAQDEAIDLYRRALGFMHETDDAARARQTLLRIGLAHHLAFEFEAANGAFGEAFARRPPPPVRLDPTERVRWPIESAGAVVIPAALSFSGPSWFIGPNIFRGLLAMGRNVDVEPDLAESFTVSDDGRSYRFTLREDAYWSDGARVTSDDFVFTFVRIAEEGLETAARLVDGVSARAVDARTLDISLSEPRNDFLYRIASPPLAAWPRHVLEREGPDWHRVTPLVGNGPFVLTSRDERRLVFEAAPAWYGARGNVREVMVGLEGSYDSVAEAWRAGGYDVQTLLALSGIPPGGDTIVEQTSGTWTWYLGFNVRRAPVDDARLRRACAHAIDRSAPATRMGATPALQGGLIPPAMPGHSQRVAPPYDPQRARALLDEARPCNDFVLACLKLWEQATQTVADQLSTIGIRVRVLAVDSDQDLRAAIDERVHAFVWAWGADIPDPGDGIIEPIVTDLPLYRDDELDRIRARAADSRDQDERLRLYREFERRWIGEQAAIVPFAYSDTTLSRRPWITGLWMNAIAMSSFAEAVVERQ
jgi:ABC-type transport system substrate-binding protein